MSNGRLHIERRADGVAMLTLDNPEHRNALNNGMIEAIIGAFIKLARDRSCRAILLRGAGGMFCAGREIDNLLALQKAGMETIHAAYHRLGEMNEAIYYCPKPVIAALDRYALGAGIMLATLADIAIATDDCLIGYPEVKLGIPPTQTTIGLIRGVHRKSVMDLVLTARNIRGVDAARMGLVTRSVPPESLWQEIEATLTLVIANGPEAMARTKELIWKTEDSDYRSALSVGTDVISVAVATHEAREGVTAFLEKRKPNW
ncbi:MAG: enoyl-CoA hydratase/isomerase family protein [bacterium]|jgi:enoyl-CoA hydratase/carnithine racemase|nr:enoyl-CoA hydratase/isomerase family protein [Roseomonas sp.]